MLTNIDRNDENRFVANQGSSKGWNYPDALFVGKGGMTNTEYGKTNVNIFGWLSNSKVLNLES